MCSSLLCITFFTHEQHSTSDYCATPRVGFTLAAKSDLPSICSVCVPVTSSEMRGNSSPPKRVQYCRMRKRLQGLVYYIYISSATPHISLLVYSEPAWCTITPFFLSSFLLVGYREPSPPRATLHQAPGNSITPLLTISKYPPNLVALKYTCIIVCLGCHRRCQTLCAYWVSVGWQRRCKTCQPLCELDNQGTIFFVF